MASALHTHQAVLGLVLTLSLAQFADPPLVQADSPSATLLAEVRDLRAESAALRSELELSRASSELSVQIATFDTSGPGSAKAARVIGYLLVIPAFLFAAPVFSGQTPAMVGLGLFSDSNTVARVGPTFNLAGILLVAIAGVSLAFGITSGIVGWAGKTMELDALVDQKAVLDAQLASLRGTRETFAMRP